MFDKDFVQYDIQMSVLFDTILVKVDKELNIMENIEMKWCQSCAMPMNSAELFGTNADGSKNEEYCQYCFANGAFTSEQTMEEMIETCVPFVSKGEPWPDEDTARKEMLVLFPQLKRWKK